MKKIIEKVFFPNKIIGFLLFNVGFGLLIYVFSYHLGETPIAYVSYILSFYALLFFSIWFYKVCKFSNDFLKKSRIYQMYQNNMLFVTKMTIFFSFLCHLIYGLLKLGIGVYYKSWWFITLSIYYLLLCFIQGTLFRNINNPEKEYAKLKRIGIFILFLNLVLVGIIVLIIRQDQIIAYHGFLIYLVALYDFYLIISAIINVIKYRKNHSPMLISSKCINLTIAMISMISLEVAMIYQFGNNEAHFKLIMTASMGFAICLINSFMAIYMIVKANKYLKKVS